MAFLNLPSPREIRRSLRPTRDFILLNATTSAVECHGSWLSARHSGKLFESIVFGIRGVAGQISTMVIGFIGRGELGGCEKKQQ